MAVIDPTGANDLLRRRVNPNALPVRKRRKLLQIRQRNHHKNRPQIGGQHIPPNRPKRTSLLTQAQHQAQNGRSHLYAHSQRDANPRHSDCRRSNEFGLRRVPLRLPRQRDVDWQVRHFRLDGDSRLGLCKAFSILKLKVVNFLVLKMNVSSVVLWGRSMGASTAVFYLSDKFRKKLGSYLGKRKGVYNYRFMGMFFFSL